MKEDYMLTRQYACQCLGVSYNASIEEIKKAYREKVKCYHPDANLQTDTTHIYMMIQKSYEYLIQNPYMPFFNSSVKLCQTNMYSMNMNYNEKRQTTTRPTRVFGNDAKVTSEYQRQKQAQKEREKVKQWEAEKRKRTEQIKENTTHNDLYSKELSKEEELLQRIKAIWIAENIRRQVSMEISKEKERIEAENKRKLYRAFMQQRMKQDEIDTNR